MKHRNFPLRSLYFFLFTGTFAQFPLFLSQYSAFLTRYYDIPAGCFHTSGDPPYAD